jgi:hypothetical protein
MDVPTTRQMFEFLPGIFNPQPVRIDREVYMGHDDHRITASLSPDQRDYKERSDPKELCGTMLAGSVKGELVRGYFKSLVWKFYRLDLPLVIDQDVVHAIAQLADKVLVPLDQRIEVLRTAAHEHLELFVGDQFLQVTINCPKANTRQFLSHSIINLVRRRMRFVVLNRIPNDL